SWPAARWCAGIEVFRRSRWWYGYWVAVGPGRWVGCVGSGRPAGWQLCRSMLHLWSEPWSAILADDGNLMALGSGNQIHKFIDWRYHSDGCCYQGDVESPHNKE